MQECTLLLTQDVWETAVRWLIGHYAFPTVSNIMQPIWTANFQINGMRVESESIQRLSGLWLPFYR